MPVKGRRGRSRPLLAAALLSALVVALVVVIFHDDFFSARGRAPRHLPAPDASLLDQAVTIATPATVKIEGSSCGLAVAGSGVVVGNGLVMTAAHVVAGSDTLRVVDSAGRHHAVAVLVDPLADLAVLSIDGLVENPLVISEAPAERGMIGAVVGYPLGGALDASPAVVLDYYLAEQHDIYQRDLIRRPVLEVQAEVLPGSSGGPVVNSDGALIGMIFGQSEDDSQVGYAAPAVTMRTTLHQALLDNQNGPVAVSTGGCLPPTAG